MTIAHGSGEQAAGSAKGPLRIAMIGLRGIPATYGGVERAVEELAAHLVGRGHDVTVYARSGYSPPNVREHRGIKIVPLPQVNTKHAEAASHTAIAITHALGSRRFDVIHLHATGPGAMSPLVRLAGVPVVVTVQGLDWRREKWGRGARAVLRIAEMVTAKSPHRTIVVSRELERHYRERHRARTVYIPNGVQIERDPGEPPQPDLRADAFVLFLGRLVPEKHVHTLIRAYRRVGGDMPLVIAGPDSHSPKYLDHLRALAAGDPRVRLIGPRYSREKAWLMHNALAFVQPSSIEGLPIALLEALSAGRFPIVSAIPENVEPVTVGGQTMGITVEVGDEAALARAIEAARAAPDRRAIGGCLSAHVRRVYDWREIAAATEAVYYDALATRRRRLRSRTGVVRLATLATAVLVLALSVNASSTEGGNAATAALARLLGSDMSRPSEAMPHGVPRWYDWSSHPRVRALTPMLSFEAFTAWGQLYQCADTPPSPNDAVDLRDLQSWALLRGSRRWRRLQLSSDLEGAAFAADYAKPAVAARYVTRGSGGTSVKLRTGYNFHFWPNSGRISLRASEIVAIVVTLRARLRPGRPLEQRPRCLVLSVGGDLWTSVSAQPGGSNSGDVGIGRFKRVERHWRLFTMSTATPNLLKQFPLPLTAAPDESQ